MTPSSSGQPITAMVRVTMHTGESRFVTSGCWLSQIARVTQLAGLFLFLCRWTQAQGFPLRVLFPRANDPQMAQD
jgi:hypothetical protein